MTDRPSPTIEDVFCKLDGWRHLPAYRLEPTLAPFFGLFLSDILRARLGIETHSTIIPEFPLRKDSLPKSANSETKNDDTSEEEETDNLSVNVDFVAFSPSLESVYFVELKTDTFSINDGQIDYLKRARKVNFSSLLSGINKICKTTNRKQKYIHLLHDLEAIGLISFRNIEKEKLYEKTFPKGKPGWSKVFGSGPTLVKPPSERCVIYITPNGKTEKLREAEFQEISFCEIADIVQTHGAFGCMFANYLRKWKAKAGSENPSNVRVHK
ncbi:MAG: hypothetical protein OXF89_09440 [Rhodospirillaceae bacterium]|nr:hypothetical protein [Rhodospirillaceae bacterium]MCY4067340.1 hypothetical protein [Rhodospirillaceae bacterium]